MNSLTETKEFDKLKISKTTYKESPRRPPVHIKIPTKQTCRYCGPNHPLRQCPAYGKKFTDCRKIGHFRGVFKSKRARSVNEVEQEGAQDSTEESTIDSVNINLIHFNKICSVITANIETLADKNSVIVPYKVDTGIDGNIMPLHTC